MEVHKLPQEKKDTNREIATDSRGFSLRVTGQQRRGACLHVILGTLLAILNDCVNYARESCDCWDKSKQCET